MYPAYTQADRINEYGESVNFSIARKLDKPNSLNLYTTTDRRLV